LGSCNRLLYSSTFFCRQGLLVYQPAVAGLASVSLSRLPSGKLYPLFEFVNSNSELDKAEGVRSLDPQRNDRLGRS
ncbi:hypothetical protein, partial [Pseudomonas amygdali]|uniref:hypothetical protein n=1 Tax=Pseudomonas amygdali TaxID=47877 RepID=UPI001F27F2B8